MLLSIILLERKVIVFDTSLEQYQHAHLCSLTRLCTVGWPTSCSYLNIPKINNLWFQEWMVGIWEIQHVKWSNNPCCYLVPCLFCFCFVWFKSHRHYTCHMATFQLSLVEEDFCCPSVHRFKHDRVPE